MKSKVLLFLFLLLANITFAQTNVSAPISLRIQKEVKPAIIELVPGSVSFVDPNGNNAIDANERCKIRFQVKNTGTGDGFNCVAKIKADGATTGVKCANVNLSTIKVGSTMTVELPVTASMNTTNGKINFQVSVDEPMGFGTETVDLAVDTRQFVSPLLKVVDYTVTGTSGSVLAKKKPFDLQLLLQNVEQGMAENVDISVTYPTGVFLMDGEEQQRFASMQAGETKSLVYSLIVNQNYASNEIPINITIREKHGKYAENRTVTLQLNQTLASNKIEIKSQEQQYKDIQIASLSSKVDKDIPVTNINNAKTFAVIIANENYQNESSYYGAGVPFEVPVLQGQQYLIFDI